MNPKDKKLTRGKNILFVSSAHDIRQPRKANMHFLAEALATHNHVRFASVGYSQISRLKSLNTRKSLWDRANRVEMAGPIEAYLWRSLLHPVNLRRPALSGVSRAAIALYRRMVPKRLKTWFAEAEIVVFECGLSSTLIPTARSINSSAKIIYNASDSVATIGADPQLMELLRKNAGAVDTVRIPSLELHKELSFIQDIRHIPHAVPKEIYDNPGPTPFSNARNAVAIGSMLFDPWVIETLAAAFPDVCFTMIGTGYLGASERANTVWHSEMKFAETLQYLGHADVSIAPYRNGTAPAYLKDTSMKLLQADEMGIPSVCPTFATDESRSLRHGYEPGNAQSLCKAFERAMFQKHRPRQIKRLWIDAAEQMIAV